MEVRFFIAMFCVALVGALYAAINVSPNKYKSREALITNPLLGILIIGLCTSVGAAVIGSFHQGILKGIIALICPVVGYCLSWYIIKIPERKYLKEQQS